jgi:hypothetical protein
MNRKLAAILLLLLFGVFGMIPGFAQKPNTRPQNPTAGGEMKESGSEAKEAGKSMGHYTKHGHVGTGTKEFGKHAGRAGKHFGSGVKKGVKRITS